MFRSKIVLLFTGIIVIGLLNLPVWGQQSSQIDKWGVGVFTGYNVPIFNFSDRFDGGPKFGLKLSFVKNNTSYEVAYFTCKYPSGKIEQAKFQWNYDGSYYSSPDASSEMVFHGITFGIEEPLMFSLGPLVPFWSIGAGFIYYKHEIKNMVFPGQSIPPMDLSFTYSPDVEERTSFTINLGGGLQYEVNSHIKLALFLKYHIIFGYLRPMEAWSIEEVSPIQTLDVGFDLIYYF